MYSITKVIIDRLIDFVENRRERSMALTENDAFDLCRQECRHILGNALYCNKEYVHAEICWETGSVLEYFVGIDDSKSDREDFPEYMDEENSPCYAYVFCDKIRLRNFKTLGLMPKGYLFALRPLIVGS